MWWRQRKASHGHAAHNPHLKIVSAVYVLTWLIHRVARQYCLRYSRGDHCQLLRRPAPASLRLLPLALRLLHPLQSRLCPLPVRLSPAAAPALSSRLKHIKVFAVTVY